MYVLYFPNYNNIAPRVRQMPHNGVKNEDERKEQGNSGQHKEVHVYPRPYDRWSLRRRSFAPGWNEENNEIIWYTLLYMW